MRKKRDSREKIVNSAITLFSRKGFDGASIRQISIESGMSVPMIYYYFKNKEGYYVALAEHLLMFARSSIADLIDPQRSLRENLLEFAKFRIRFVRENSGMANAFISVMMDPNIGQLIQHLHSEFDVMRLEFIDPMFDRAVARGEIKSDTDRYAVMLMLNSTITAISIKLIKGITHDIEISVEDVVDIICDGIIISGEDN